MIELVQVYIDQCKKCTEMSEAEKLVKEIDGVFHADIKNFTNELDRYSMRHMNSGTTTDYLSDIQLLEKKLQKYKVELMENQRSEERELEKLRLQAEIAKSNMNVTVSATGGSASSEATSTATSTVTITLTQTIENIKKIPDEVLSPSEKEELDDMLVLVDSASKNGDRDKTWNKVGKILKYLTDKGIEVGIATLPYLGEITKLLGNQ